MTKSPKYYPYDIKTYKEKQFQPTCIPDGKEGPKIRGFQKLKLVKRRWNFTEFYVKNVINSIRFPFSLASGRDGSGQAGHVTGLFRKMKMIQHSRQRCADANISASASGIRLRHGSIISSVLAEFASASAGISR